MRLSIGAPATRRDAAAILGVLALALVLWGPGLDRFFDLDDFVLLEGSRSTFARAASLPAWLSAVFLDEGLIDHNYRPLSTHGVFLLVQSAFGASPRAFHALNLLLHAGTALLVAAMARRLGLGVWPAAAGALFYVSRDALFGAVAWAAGVQDGLMAFLSVASLLAMARAVAGEGRAARTWQAGSVLLMLGALLAKESAYVLPLLATATALAFAPRRDGRGLRAAASRSAPHWAVLLAFAAFRAFLLPLNLEQYPFAVPLSSLERPGLYAFWSVAGVPLEEGRSAALRPVAIALGWLGIAAVAIAALRTARGPRRDSGGRAIAFGGIWWLVVVAFLTAQLWRFHMYYLSLALAGGALVLAGLIDVLLATRPSSRVRILGAAVLVAALVTIGGALVHAKSRGDLASGGYMIPARAEQNRWILDYVRTRGAKLLGIRRVIFVDWVDRGVVGADPDGRGYRGVSPIASMLRHHFDRPDLQVLYSFPPDSPALRTTREQDYLKEHVTSHDVALPAGPGPGDLLVHMR